MRMAAVKNKVCLILIVLIALAAVGARIVGLSYDHLIAYNHDEQIHLLTAQAIYRGVVNPREIWEGRKFLYVFYPWLSMYIVAAVYYLYGLVVSGYSFLTGGLIYLAGEGGRHLKDFTPPGEPSGRTALYLGRLTVALIGAANVPLLYLVGKRIWDRRVGLLAAGILALNGYHVANCHWLKNDIIAAFFLTAAFFFILRIYLRGKTVDYLLAAVFSAVAVNTKHYGAPILASALFAHLLALPRLTLRGLFRSLVARKFIFFVLAFLLVFAATYPLLYLDLGYIVENFGEMAARTESDAMFGTLGSRARPRTFFQIRRDNLINFARFAWEMEAGIGPYVLLLGLGGIAASIYSRRKRLLLAASFPLVYLAAAVLVASPGVRYQDVIPLIPFVALLAAAFIRWFFGALFAKKRGPATAAAMAAGLVLLAPYLRMVVRMDYGYWERSVRYFASHWAARNIPPGSAVLRESKTISLDGSRYKTRRVRALWDRDVEVLASAGADYLVVASRHESRALEETGLFGPDHPFGQFYLSLPTRYDLVKEFSLGVIPYRGGGSKIWQLRRDYPLSPGGINSALLRRLQHDLSFSTASLFFPDPEGCCQGTTAFVVPPRARTGRLVISPQSLPWLGVQVVNGPRPGRVRIRTASGKITEEFAAGQTRQYVVPPRPGFPYIDYSYRVSVSSPRSSPCLVRLLTDPYRIALGYLDTGDYAEAADWLEEAVRADPGDWYLSALLAAARGKGGEREQARRHLAAAERIFPGWRQAREILVDDELPAEIWSGKFQSLTGLRPDWLAERAGRVWYDDEWEETPLAGGGRRIEIAGLHLPPGDYRIRLTEKRRGPAQPVSVLVLSGERLLHRWDSAGGAPRPEMSFASPDLGREYTLIVEEPSPAIREILVHPRAESIRFRFSGYLRDLDLPEEEG